MSVAYYITTNPADDEIVGIVDGKLLVRDEDQINALAAAAGLATLDAFLGMPDLGDFGIDIDIDIDQQSDNQQYWHAAQDGVAWFETMFAAVSDHPDEFDEQAELLDELDDFVTALKLADKRGLQWQLGMDL